MKTEMTLGQARRIARRVGARIVSREPAEEGFTVTIPGRAIAGESSMTRWASSPLHACHIALIETAKHAREVYELCKRVYVEENLLFTDDDQ